jgi:hypothetical protein
MFKKALQINELILCANSNIIEDYVQNTDVTIPSQITDNSFFIQNKKSGKEIVINGTFILNDENLNPNRNGFNYSLAGYTYEIKNLSNNKIMRLLAVAQDDRIYSINVKVKQVDIINITAYSFDYTITCYSDTYYWLDVTDLLFYSILLKDNFIPQLYNYQNEIKFLKNEIIQDRLVVIEPKDNFGLEKIKEYKKFYQYNKNTFQIQASGDFYVYILVSQIPFLKISVNNIIYNLENSNSIAVNSSSFADCINISYYVNNSIPDFDIISYIILLRKI